MGVQVLLPPHCLAALSPLILPPRDLVLVHPGLYHRLECISGCFDLQSQGCSSHCILISKLLLESIQP